MKLAYKDEINKEKWIANVKNNNEINVTFTAIDNCITIYRKKGEKERSCDGMLTYTDNIVFVELKEKRKNWITDGTEQLEKTISKFAQNHNLMSIKKRRAFLSNKKHPLFKHSHKEEMQKFHKKFKVRLIINNTIKL